MLIRLFALESTRAGTDILTPDHQAQAARSARSMCANRHRPPLAAQRIGVAA